MPGDHDDDGDDDDHNDHDDFARVECRGVDTLTGDTGTPCTFQIVLRGNQCRSYVTLNILSLIILHLEPPFQA